MKIVKVGFHETRQCVVRVLAHGAEVEVGGPNPQDQRVRAKQQRPHAHRPHVGDDVFKGVRVGSADGQRRLPLVVLLVEAFVEPSVVQHPDC